MYGSDLTFGTKELFYINTLLRLKSLLFSILLPAQTESFSRKKAGKIARLFNYLL